MRTAPPRPLRKRLSAERNRLLAASLERLHARYGVEDLGDDPIRFARRFTGRADQEAAALVSCLFAFGRVAHIGASLDRIFAILGESPAKSLERHSLQPGSLSQPLSSFRHRFCDGRSAAALLHAIGVTLRREGSLEALFAKGIDRPDASDLFVPLTRFAHEIRRRGAEAGPGAGWEFLVSDPEKGGASKRWNLFLRWVVRPGPIDLGLWSVVRPAQLTIPLDTHVGRISRYLRLTNRKASDRRAAEETTAALAAIDPDDPVRFDFALCKLGVLDICRARPQKSLCERCEISDCCPIPRTRSARERVRRRADDTVQSV